MVLAETFETLTLFKEMIFALHRINLPSEHRGVLVDRGASRLRILLVLNVEGTRTLLHRIYLHQKIRIVLGRTASTFTFTFTSTLTH